MEQYNFEDYKKEVLEKISKTKSIILVTSADNHITTRTVCPLSYGSSILVSTGKYSTKIEQIKKNPKVAFVLGEMNIEATAIVYGHPSTYPDFLKDYNEKYPELCKFYDSNPDDILVVAEITRIHFYKYKGKPGKDIIDFKEEKAYYTEI